MSKGLLPKPYVQPVPAVNLFVPDGFTIRRPSIRGRLLHALCTNGGRLAIGLGAGWTHNIAQSSAG